MGLLLAGIGHRDSVGRQNFMIVGPETTQHAIESFFDEIVARDVSIIVCGCVGARLSAFVFLDRRENSRALAVDTSAYREFFAARRDVDRVSPLAPPYGFNAPENLRASVPLRGDSERESERAWASSAHVRQRLAR